MGTKVDLTGKVFGKWHVVEETPARNKGGSIGWICKCTCGYEKIVFGASLVSGTTRSCGKCRRLPTNTYEIDGDTVHIICSDGTKAVIDHSDFDKVRDYQWFVGHSGYICTKVNIGGRRNLELHRLILCPPDGLYVDHISRNRLDNRKSNLRLCTHQQNSFNKALQKNNKTGFKGVSLQQKSGKFISAIRAFNKTKYLGIFEKAEEAAYAYDEAAKEYFGEFAWLNFP